MHVRIDFSVGWYQGVVASLTMNDNVTSTAFSVHVELCKDKNVSDRRVTELKFKKLQKIIKTMSPSNWVKLSEHILEIDYTKLLSRNVRKYNAHIYTFCSLFFS